MIWLLLLGLAGAQESPEDTDERTLLEEYTDREQGAREAYLEEWKNSAPQDDPDAAAPELNAPVRLWDDEEEPEYLTVIVISDEDVAVAREKVVLAMEEIGWKAKRRGDGTISFKGPAGWMGRATLRPSGDIDWSQPALTVPGPKATGGDYTASGAMGRDPEAGTVGAAFQTPGKKKARAVQSEVRAAVQPAVVAYRRTILQKQFAEQMSELPDKLDRLWTTGTSLYGDELIPNKPARRAEILELWATRADTPEGRTAARAIEAWIRNTIMDGPDAVTKLEAEQAEAKREDGRTLDVFR